MYDVIVVGARCAGAPTAMLLARKGHRVLMVDRATFPSDTMSTHFIQLPGMIRLSRWGLAERLYATNCPPVTEGRLSVDGDVAAAEFERPDNIPGLLAPRRTILDKMLVDAAVEAGAKLAEGVYVDSLTFDENRVTGIEAHTSQGAFAEKARFVIGADGRNSVVARSVEPEFVKYCDAVGAGFYTYFSNLECTRGEIYLHSNRFSVAFPTNDGLTLVAAGQPPEVFPEWKRDIEGNFLAHCDTMGDLGPRVRAAKREEKFVGAADIPNFIRKSWGPGWALVGDASYHKDPTPADGITDAFRGADMLSESIDAALTGRSSEEDALHEFQKQLEAASLPLYEQTMKMSSFDVAPFDRVAGFLEIQALHSIEIASMPTVEAAA
ncbi:MAG: NAD(P)/FAD-dependent oxidoreductase [Actinomycetota bacterium]